MSSNLETFMDAIIFYKEKARRIKKMYGGIDQQVGLLFCEGLIDYYNSL